MAGVRLTGLVWFGLFWFGLGLPVSVWTVGWAGLGLGFNSTRVGSLAGGRVGGMGLGWAGIRQHMGW